MQILLIHLSDLHLASVDDEAAARLLLVRQTVLADLSMPDACFIVLSGDVTNKGKASEFEVATLYLQDIRAALLTAGVPQVEFIAVPGNHDCDLELQDQTRDYILETLATFLEKPINYAGSTYLSVIAPQKPFFAFQAELCKHQPIIGSQQLYDRRLFTVGGKTLTFQCFNTAWLSRRHELQAQLFIPPDILKPPPVDSFLTISVFHHPYNWLSSHNYLAFREFIEASSNFGLCGHEHAQRIERVTPASTDPIDYFHAPAFFDPGSSENGFSTILINMDESTQKASVFLWNGTRFSKAEEVDSNIKLQRENPNDPFSFTDDFRKTLDEIGTGFQHPRCMPPHCELKLHDVFVYPDLRHQTLDRILGTTNGSENIHGEEITDFLAAKGLVIIYGSEGSGKTALARTLCQDLRRTGYLPLFLTGEEIRHRRREAQLKDYAKRMIDEQYGDRVSEEFLQFDNSRKVLIIDDFDKARLTLDEQRTLLATLLPHFPRCLILGSDHLQVQEMTTSNQSSPFRSFQRCSIKDFGRFHRFRLCEKWVYLRREQAEDPQELERKVISVNRTLTSLIGKNVLPHHPVIILHLLQLLESGEVSNMANGSYGYMYEVLIKGALARVNPQDVEVKITYISRVGYSMFTKREQSLTEDELKRVHEEYLAEYDMDKGYERMKGDLLASKTLVEGPREVYRFKYPYIAYYSIAKYFSDHRATMADELRKVADRLYSELNANVLIFYMYLTKDIPLIDYMVCRAKLIYSEETPCDMETSVDFLNKLYSASPPPLELSCGDARANRQVHHRKQDQAEEDQLPAKAPAELEVAYDASLEEFIKLGYSFKTLHILGQILRNFTGSLEGPVKLQVTSECYLLGMRTLQRVLSITSDVEMMRQYIGGLVAERTGVSDKQELAGRTDLAIVWLSVVSGFGFVKRVAYAVGHPDLSKTYSKVLAADGSLSTGIIDVAIKLDHSARAPERELKALKTRVQDNTYATMIIRDLVAEFLYLYTVDFPTVQTLGAMWNINVSPATFLTNRSKKGMSSE